jgi:hypothetical protein
MHLPRIRFTLRAFMFAVAIVAANLWAFELFCEAGRGRLGHISNTYTANLIIYRVSPVAVGVLPLLNVALLASWVCITSTLQCVRDGRAANLRSSASRIAAKTRKVCHAFHPRYG